MGTATALDVAQQATVVATLNAAVPPLEQQFRQTVDALAILVGQLPEAVDITSGTLTDISHPAVRPGLPARGPGGQAEPGTGQFLPRGPYEMIKPTGVLPDGFDASLFI